MVIISNHLVSPPYLEVADRGGVPLLIQLAEEAIRGGGTPEARTHAACALKNLTGGGDAGARCELNPHSNADSRRCNADSRRFDPD